MGEAAEGIVEGGEHSGDGDLGQCVVLDAWVVVCLHGIFQSLVDVVIAVNIGHSP